MNHLPTTIFKGTFVRFRGSVSPAAPPAVPSMARLVLWTPERDVPQLLRKWSLKPPGKVVQFDPLFVAKTAFDLIPFFCGSSFFAWFNFQFDINFSGWWITYRRWFYIVPYVLFSYCWWWKDPYRRPEVLEKNRLSNSNKLAGKKGMKFDFSILHVFNFGRVISLWKWRKNGHNKRPTKKVAILGKIYKHQVVNCQLFQQNPLTDLHWCMQIAW